MNKVLIIAYYWPPAGGPGVQRWLKFVKYLPQFGIEPVLYIPENPNYPIEDASLIHEVPKNLTIYRNKISEPYKFAKLFSSKKTKRISSGVIHEKNQSFIEKLMLWVRGNFFIPDARKNWVKPSVDFLTDVLQKEGISTVITTGPPHSMHLIGLALKKKHHIKWIADFRDPWTTIGYHKRLKLTKASKAKHKQLEKEVIATADEVVVTSKSTKTEFLQIADNNITVITNGHDIVYNGDAQLDNQFTITHIGSLLTGRNPENLWKVLSELVMENSQFRTHFQLNLVGVVSDSIVETIYKYELGPYLKTTSYIPHKQAITLQQSAQILLLIEIDSADTKGIIAGKLFEYMAAQRPILGLGPKNWEVGDIIKETNAGKTFDYQETAELKKIVLHWFNAYLNENLQANCVGIETYSRKELTKKLANLL